jgi:predicted dehydrogenase
MHRLTRRDFLQGSAALAAACATGGLLSDRRTTQAAQAGNTGGANERLNVAVIGVNGRGRDHVTGFAGRHNCVVTHVCDADSAVAGRALDTAERQQRQRPEFVQDLRRIMDNRNIHIVSIATPNHWHALAAIWAIQAGKDVYVEKPVSHNVSEGRRIVEAARHHNRICQAGTQSRSSAALRQAIEYLRNGRLGRLEVARALCYKRRRSIGQVNGAGRIPATVNYDLWCGPAPVQTPLRRINLHYDWHWTWDYGNGDLGNQGIHQMDIARWGLGRNDIGSAVVSLGGRFGYTDDGETANTQICVHNYGEQRLIFEVRGLETPAFRGATIGNIFHCADGYLVVDSSYRGAVAFNRDGERMQQFTGGGNHYENFVRAVRSRRAADLTGDILEGHLSSALCHLGNISYRLGTMQAFAPRGNPFGDDSAANETMNRMEEHLRANNVDLGATQYRLGRRLTVEPRTEQFVNDAEANRHLTREYRRGFEVPARIG